MYSTTTKASLAKYPRRLQDLVRAAKLERLPSATMDLSWFPRRHRSLRPLASASACRARFQDFFRVDPRSSATSGWDGRFRAPAARRCASRTSDGKADPAIALSSTTATRRFVSRALVAMWCSPAIGRRAVARVRLRRLTRELTREVRCLRQARLGERRAHRRFA
jgi:hypothetical protein